MEAEEIRKWSEKIENTHPEYFEKAKVRILFEIAAQLAELNSRLSPDKSWFKAIDRIASAVEGLENAS